MGGALSLSVQLVGLATSMRTPDADEALLRLGLGMLSSSISACMSAPHSDSSWQHCMTSGLPCGEETSGTACRLGIANRATTAIWTCAAARP